MCGRFTLAKNELALEERFSRKTAAPFLPHYNIYPTMLMPFIRKKSNTFEYAQWGLSVQDKKGALIINAKSETIFQRPLFKSLIYSNRCLIPADGFIEWDQTALHQPYYFQSPKQPIFCFAGIYQEHIIQGKHISYFAIITTSAQGDIANIHSRMPFIVAREQEEKWLTDFNIKEFDFQEIQSLNFFEKWPISSKINLAKNNASDLLLPIKKQHSLFDT